MPGKTPHSFECGYRSAEVWAPPKTVIWEGGDMAEATS